MDVLHAVRLVGGFARAGSINGDAYLQAKVDPLSAFAVPIMRHMNEDHADSLVAMIQHYVGVPVSQAKMIGLDRLGMLVSNDSLFDLLKCLRHTGPLGTCRLKQSWPLRMKV